MKPLPTVAGLLAATAVISYAAHTGWLTGLAILGLIVCAAIAANARKDRNLTAAPSGATRVQTVKQQWVNQTVQQYAQAGWQVIAQSSAKSFGSQARVTLTFRKP
jgi:hypothetical protein